MTHSLIIATLVSSIVSIFAILYSKYIDDKEHKREEEKKYKVLLDLRREKFESQLYTIVDSQPMDNLILTGSQELYVQTKSDKFTLSTKSIDDTFFKSMGLNPDAIDVEKKMACIVMPFHNKYDKIFTSIKNGCVKAGFSPCRTDENYVVGDILRNIVDTILRSQVVIAVIDGNNPNVFYEIGIAHSIGKPVIFIANKNRMDANKFDLDHNRIILYNNIQELESELLKYINNIN